MSENISRRYFFYGSLLAGAVPTAGFGSVPSLRALGYKPFYDKLNVAAIGCGGQGGAILNDAARTENIVALCDVDWERGAANLKKYEQGGQVQRLPRHARQGRQEHRRLHHRHPGLHARHRGAGLHAARQARLRGEAAHPHAVGSAPAAGGGGEVQGGHPDGQPGLLARMQPRGGGDRLVGRDRRRDRGAHLDHSGHAPDRVCSRLPPEEPVPATLEWDLWLGGAGMRPFSRYYVPYNWRGFLDFGTGQIGNWATHTAGPVHTALQLGAPLTRGVHRA